MVNGKKVRDRRKYQFFCLFKKTYYDQNKLFIVKSILKIIIHVLKFLPGGSSGKALGYELDGPGVGRVEIFLHSFVSRLVLGSTELPIKSVSGNFSGSKGERAFD